MTEEEKALLPACASPPLPSTKPPLDPLRVTKTFAVGTSYELILVFARQVIGAVDHDRIAEVHFETQVAVALPWGEVQELHRVLAFFLEQRAQPPGAPPAAPPPGGPKVH